MRLKSFTYMAVSIMAGILFLSCVPVHAESMDMEEVKKQFEEKTGKKWSEAASDQRRDFMYELRGEEKKEERLERVKGVDVPFYIREGYRKEYRQDWEDATQEEQEKFIDDYKELKKKWDKEEKERRKEERLRVKKIRKEKKLEEKERREREKLRAKRDKDEEKELTEKRKAERKRIEDMKKANTALRKKLKDMRDRTHPNRKN